MHLIRYGLLAPLLHQAVIRYLHGQSMLHLIHLKRVVSRESHLFRFGHDAYLQLEKMY